MSKLRIFPKAQHALQAMKGQETLRQIRIRAANDDRACIIRVSDSGPGLPGEGRGSLLMPHMAGARQPDGTGWGLKSSPIWSAGLAGALTLFIATATARSFKSPCRTMRRALRAMRRMAMRRRRWKRRHRCRRRRDRQLLTSRVCPPMLDPNRWRG